MIGRLKWLAPSLLTTAGAILSLAWLGGAPWYVGAAGLALDAADGWAARRLDTVTTWGAWYDRSTDAALAAVLLYQAGAPWLLPALVAWQALAHVRGIKSTGRAPLMLAALACDAAGWRW